MAVSPEITRQHLREELSLLEDLATTYNWEVTTDFNHLVLLVKMRAHNDDHFILEIRCDNYKEMPPFFEFIDPDSGQRGTPHAYPKGKGDSLFHNSGPCICAPFNRKAYKSIVDTGPHGDWSLGDWMTSTANSVQWTNFSKLGDMLGLIQNRISRPDLYGGRMA
jgi:hypothetical protein